MNARSTVKINAASFKVYMNVTLFVKETDTVLERMDGCN